MTSIELRRARRNRMARRRRHLGRIGNGPLRPDADQEAGAIAAAVEGLPTGWGRAPKGWLLEALGFYGLDAVEEGLLVALVTGEPILLVGRHGTAKTAICCRLGKLLELQFHAYDAAKALFEDVVGFPDPSSLARGEVSYVPTPMSLWDKEFILVDELSRAQPQMQNKWLEVIRSHRLMGRGLPRLKYVIAAMNPSDYLGAIPLDEALLSRFAVVVKMPEVTQMGEEVALRVIGARSEDDAPLLGEALSGTPGNGKVLALARRRLVAQLEKAKAALPRVEQLLGDRVVRYVHEVSLHLAERGHGLDARRLGMIRRNLLVALSLSQSQSQSQSLSQSLARREGRKAAKESAGEEEGGLGALGLEREQASSLVGRTLGLSLPFAADGRPGPSAEMLGLIHREAFEQALGERENGSDEGQPTRSSVLHRAGRHQLASYRRNIEDLTLEEHYRVTNDVLRRAQEALPERLVAAWSGEEDLAELVREHASQVPWEVTEHLLDDLAVRLGLAEALSAEVVAVCHEEEVDPHRAGIARRARQCVAHVHRQGRGEVEDAVRLFGRLREQGELS